MITTPMGAGEIAPPARRSADCTHICNAWANLPLRSYLRLVPTPNPSPFTNPPLPHPLLRHSTTPPQSATTR
jgi:hypothetical protein